MTRTGGLAVKAGNPGVKRRAPGFPFVLLAAVVLAGCTAGEVERFFYAGGKIAYDSLRARQQAD